MHRTQPPFRADHVGSLLRSAALREARAKREANQITAEQLQAVEDREIEAIIRKQEAAGLESITDGEFRRAFWNYDFLGKLPGVEAYLGERKIAFQGRQPKPMMLRVIGRLGSFTGHPMIDHFKFVQSHTKQTAKMTIPSPSSLHFRYGRSAVPEAIYPDMEEFYHDLGATYRKAVRAFADAGCRYIQLDEVNFTYLCDPKLRQQVTERGDDPNKMPHDYAKMINAAISDVPPGMTTAMHLCRGNFQSTFVASGSTRSRSRHILWSMTPSVQAGSSRCASCRRARPWYSASSRQNRACWSQRTRSSAGSTRRRNTYLSTSSACRRSAALPPPRRATSSPRRSSGQSCG
jgi:5-methyltetrahydropteroyltriglutamate--homocysteine methyltransferase